jgi:alkanesulfonate monooxygenase SsuD/methylene tetrahydromethanopterin reductase-like flavin-dependent oxidoreductase (luciferase family)
MFPTDTAIRPDHLAREVESRGFESLWFPEHSHIPVSRSTPWGGQHDAPPLPDHYWRTYDQFVALAYAATATSELKLGSGITLVALPPLGADVVVTKLRELERSLSRAS